MKKSLLALTLATISVGSVASTNYVVETPSNASEFVLPAKGGVNWDNYVEAESDWNFLETQDLVGVNAWKHDAPVTIDNQTIIRSNADMLYSTMVVDVSKGATFTVTDTNNDEYQMMQLLDENHRLNVVVRRGESVTITPDDLTSGTHVFILARTKVTADMADSVRRQELLKVEANSNVSYEGKGYLEKDVIDYRLSLITSAMQGGYMPTAERSFRSDDAYPLDYRYGAAYGWAGLPPSTAAYLERITDEGSTSCQEWRIPKPNLNTAVGGYFSITTYGADGWIAKDGFNIEGDDMRQNDDGTLSAFFNCDDPKLSAYNLSVEDNWAAIVRFYEPANVEETIDYLQSLRSMPVTPVTQ
ncbi:DUF1254 domain-containing protein [Vibrio splendidus]|uniref:DUF1254 domain-containing protein n=1 Tax=Vibrio splendidus TaxID=29497 RepID=UPI00076AB4AB|nr:DUF1254 domain-containing protein [Vibrio splendidus]PHX05298.1 hypothetical protein VSPL_30810 [Vibrio splendidus]